YASNYAGIANTWKNFIGQVRGVKRLKVIDRKREIEKEFQEWINADESRTKKYGSLFRDIEAAYKDLPGSFTSFVYLTVGLLGPGILEYSQEFTSLEQQLKEIKDNPAAPVETAKTLRESAKEHFKNYNAPTDQKLMAGLYAMYGKDIPLDQQVGIYKELSEKCKGDYEKFASELFENSIFSNEAKVNAFLDNPSAKKLAKDPAYILGGQLTSKIMELSGGYRKSQSKLSKYNRLFIDGLRQMYPDKVFYPDANSTMRLSYGSIEDYYPADAVHYDYVTYLSGVMEKEVPSNDEFIVPQKLKELFVTKDYGRYGKDGKLITCFLSTNDITGGNSGSPVINGNGELIGLAFDGNWEAMSGDIAFEPELQRTICVDIRYVMFIIDKFAGAKNLIDELTIAN
ncbi:MAG: S46 family peptidase, partial [Bacteroidetes bacterium]|nr:S46 family peptidase [Bacteroidota bacterium]